MACVFCPLLVAVIMLIESPLKIGGDTSVEALVGAPKNVNKPVQERTQADLVTLETLKVRILVNSNRIIYFAALFI